MLQNVRDLAAVLIMIVAAGWGIYHMIRGELVVVPPFPVTQAAVEHMLSGLKQYCYALGIILFLGGCAYILVGQSNDVRTVLNPPEDKKS